VSGKKLWLNVAGFQPGESEWQELQVTGNFDALWLGLVVAR
jgi:hypothetical protein